MRAKTLDIITLQGEGDLWLDWPAECGVHTITVYSGVGPGEEMVIFVRPVTRNLFVRWYWAIQLMLARQQVRRKYRDTNYRV